MLLNSFLPVSFFPLKKMTHELERTEENNKMLNEELKPSIKKMSDSKKDLGCPGFHVTRGERERTSTYEVPTV